MNYRNLWDWAKYKNRFAQCTLGTALAATLGLAATGVPSSSASAQELLGYWRLEETNFDADVLDSSGNNLNGFFDGFGLDPDVEGAPGFGSGVFLDGQTDRILIDDFENEGVFGNLTNDFTVMAWINPNSFDSKNRIFGGFPVGGGWGFGTVRDELEITTYGVRDYDQPVPLELDTWTHVAVAMDADNAAHFYVNGEFVGTQTHDAPGIATENEFYIGASCCDAEYFSGYLDEVAVFSGALDARQISNAANLAVLSYDAPAVNPDGLRFQLDFATVQGAAEGWDIIDEIDAGDECDYLGNAATPCTIFELTDLEGIDNDVTLEIMERPFIGNSTPNDSLDPYVFDGTAIPAEAIRDYQYRDPDEAGTSAPFRFSNLDPGTYSVTVFEGRTNDGNGQFAKLWVGDANGSNEPGVAGAHDGQNTGDFAAGSATLSLEVGEGEYLWYRHLEDNSGGISGLVIRSVGDVGPECDPNSGGDLDGNGTVEFADFLILSGNFGTEVADHAQGDIDCNGTVEFADFLVLSGNFGTQVGGTQSVPEPSGWTLLGLAGLVSGRLRRRRN